MELLYGIAEVKIGVAIRTLHIYIYIYTHTPEVVVPIINLATVEAAILNCI